MVHFQDNHSLSLQNTTIEGEIAQHGASIVFKHNIASYREHNLHRLDRVLPKYFKGSFKNTK